MPIYEYQCKKCESKFEVLQSINADNRGLICPSCDASEPTKVFSRFAPLGNGKPPTTCEMSSTCEMGST